MSKYRINFVETNLYLGEGGCMVDINKSLEFSSVKKAENYLQTIELQLATEITPILETRREKVENWWSSLSESQQLDLVESKNKRITNLLFTDLDDFYKQRFAKSEE